MEQGAVVCRDLFCEDCWKADRRLLGVQFIVYGSTSKQYRILEGENYGVRGFTPHIVIFIRTEGQNVLYQTICAVQGCGVSIKTDNFIIETKYTHVIPMHQWQALVHRYKDTGYEV